MSNKVLITNFINNLKYQERSPSTIIAYKKDLEQLNTYLTNERLTFITAESAHLTAFTHYLTNQMGFTPKTVSRKTNSLKTFYLFLHNNNHIKENIANFVRHPKVKPKPRRILSILEYKAIRDTARSSPRLYAIIQVLLQTGIRIGELARLKLEDVDINSPQPYFFIRKFASNYARKVDLNKDIVATLNSWMQKRPVVKNDTAYLFITKNGTQLIVRNIRTSINKSFHSVEIHDATVNDIRNTFITFQLAAGVKLDKVSEIVGHQRLSSTKKYMEYIASKPDKYTNKIQIL